MVLAYLDEGSSGGVGPLEVVLLLLGLGLLWILPSLLIARLAGRKGYSSNGYFVVSILVSWILAGIVIALLPDRTQPPQAAAASGGTAASDHLDQLQKITTLRDAGTLSDEEFEAEKARIMEPGARG